MLRVLKHKYNNESGAIFVTVLLLVMLVSVTAVSVAVMSRAQVDRFFYVQNHIVQYPFLSVARSYAIKMIESDENDDLWTKFDYPGVIGVVSQPDESVYTVTTDDMIVNFGEDDAAGNFRPGFYDEDGKLNINSLSPSNQRVLFYLLEYLEIKQDQSEDIVASVLDWKDIDLMSSHKQERLELDYYQRQREFVKPMNKPFVTVQELRYVRGMTDEVYATIKPYITVYPLEGAQSKVNFLTSTEPVLYALLRSLPVVSSDDAQFIAKDFVRLRTLFFADYVGNAAVGVNDIITMGNWSARHQLLLQSAYQKYGKIRSDIIRIPVILKTNQNNVPMKVEYLYDRSSQEIIGRYMY